MGLRKKSSSEKEKLRKKGYRVHAPQSYAQGDIDRFLQAINDTTEIQVATNDGKLIYSTKPFRLLDDISRQDFFKNIEKETGYFISEEAKREKLFSYAKSKGYKDFLGMNWIVITSHDTDEVLGSVYILRDNILLTSSIFILIVFIISVYVYRSVSNPIMKLSKVVSEIIDRPNYKN